MLRGPLAENGVRGQFSGHETFPIRYGWLKKVVDAMSASDTLARDRVFNPDVAIAHFGVGKNMVASMRHWALATGVLEPDDGRGLRLSSLGKLIFSDGGLDPYLEQPASLWILHWRLAASPEKTTTWYWAFNHYNAITIDRQSLIADMARLVKEQNLSRVSAATIRRDVDCFFRTYVVSHSNNRSIGEGGLECPLAELELIIPTAVKGVYEFQRGPKPTLPDSVFNFALAEFWDWHRTAETLSIETVTYEPGSPGRIFKLDEQSVVNRLSRIEETSSGTFRWSDTAGLQQVLRTEHAVNPFDFLKAVN